MRMFSVAINLSNNNSQIFHKSNIYIELNPIIKSGKVYICLKLKILFNNYWNDWALHCIEGKLKICPGIDYLNLGVVRFIAFPSIQKAYR